MGNYTKKKRPTSTGRQKKRNYTKQLSALRLSREIQNETISSELRAENKIPSTSEVSFGKNELLDNSTFTENDVTVSDYEAFDNDDFNVEEDLPELILTNEAQPKDDVDLEDISGRRIVNIKYFFGALKSLKHDGFGCSFFDMDLVSEKRIGFESVFCMHCKMCNMKSYIHTEFPESNHQYMNINAAATNASLVTGGGYRQLSAFCSAVDIPSISSRTFNSYQNQLAVVINTTALDEMKLAAQEEARIAKERGSVDRNGIPIITVIADGAWSKRSYRSNYNALSGVACIVGLETKKILFISVKNRYCMICDSNVFKKEKQHFCFKNWNGSSTGMEAAAILEGFCSSIEMHGLIFGKLVGDGDSSVYRKITETLPYGTNVLVEKIECTNHILRNYINKLRDLKTKTGYDAEDKKFINNNIMRFRNAITSAIKYRKNENRTMSEQIILLEKDILNSVHHILGNHVGCASYFCDKEKENVDSMAEKFKNNGLLNELQKPLKRVADNAKSLIYELNNNPAEIYNSYVAQFVGGKKINYSLRGSYKTRCEIAATAYNSDGQLLSRIHEAYTGNEAGQYTKKYCDRETYRRKPRREKSKVHLKRKKNIKYSGPDRNYGPDAAAEKPDISEDEYKQKKETFLKELKEIDATELEKHTREQSNSELWMKERLKRLTASRFGEIANMRKTTSRAGVVDRILYKTFSNAATEYGNTTEKEAIKKLEERMSITVHSCGMFIHTNKPFFAASPDGLVEEDAIVEIKCPYSAKNINIKDAVSQKKLPCLELKGGKINLRKTHKYFHQIQGQLEITNRQYCYFAIYTKCDIFVEIIYRNKEFWNNHVNKLENFYFDYLLKELLDPRKVRFMELRN